VSAIAKFLSLGMADADRRVGAALAPAPLEPADRYLRTSSFVMAIDRMTRRLHDWWLASEAGQAVLMVQRVFREPSAVWLQGFGLVLLIAAVVNIALTLLNGPRPGWSWLIIPAMVAAFAVLLLAGSRSPDSTD